MFPTSPRRVFPAQALRLPVLVLMLSLLVLLGSRMPLPTSIPAVSLPELDFDNMPLAFIPNAGQHDPAVRFQAGALGGTLFFTPDAVTLALPARDHRPPTTDHRPLPVEDEAHQAVVGRQSSVVVLRFDGANPQPRLVGAEQLPSTVNYFIGEPASWHSDLPAYAGIVYQQLYAGVDLRYDGQEGALKGTYTVAPGADPSRIRWRYEGAQGLRIDGTSGDLLIAMPSTSAAAFLTEQAPIAWQDMGGRRVPVAVRYELAGDGLVGFALGSYDAAHPLTIDPYLLYSAFIGGDDADEGRDIAVDALGNVYVTGSTRSLNFPKAGPPQPAYAGPTGPGNFGDAFIMKLNPAGTALVYMTYLGGSLQDVGDAITVDADGNAYVTGMTESTNFPTKSALQPTPGGNSCSVQPCSDAFVAKLNPAGNALVFSTYLGGNRDENNGVLDVGTRHMALGIAVDSARNVYVTGLTDSPNFPTINPAFTDTDGAFSDIFVAKIRPDGAALLYSSYLGGGGADFSGDIVADNAGNAYIVGATLSTTFPTKNPLQGQNAGPGADAVVAKFDTTKSGAASLLYSSYLGGGDSDYGFGIAIDGGGNIYLAGHTTSLNFPVENAFQASNANPADAIPQDVFVAKLNPAGSQLLYSSYLGGAGDDVGYGLDIDSSGTIYVTGQTSSDNFPVKGAWQPARADFVDVFVARLDPTKSGAGSLVYSTYLGGNGSEKSYGIAVDSARNAYVTGTTGPASLYEFPTTVSIGQNGSTAGIFITKFSPSPTQRVHIPLVQR